MNSVTVKNITIGEGMPKICVPIAEKTLEGIFGAAKEIVKSPADFVEWRADWVEEFMDLGVVEQVLLQLQVVLNEKPILFTYRTKNEGGQRDISFGEYASLLKFVASKKLADIIDVEVYFDENVPDLIAELKQSDVIVLGSNHDFEKTPQRREIVQTLGYMQFIGADILKMAVMPQNKQDVLMLLSATEEMVTKHATRPVITMAMGNGGVISRMTGEIFGSAVTFGALGQASAPGQINVYELKKMLEMLHSIS